MQINFLVVVALLAMSSPACAQTLAGPPGDESYQAPPTLVLPEGWNTSHTSNEGSYDNSGAPGEAAPPPETESGDSGYGTSGETDESGYEDGH